MASVNKEPRAQVGSLIRSPLATKECAFTPGQQEVIAHRGSPLVVLGGPGTGKTTVLVESALARVADAQDPNSILMITYGRERASELRDAVALRTTAIMKEPIARTFHSLAFSILKMKAAETSSEPILMSGPEQESFIRDLLEGDRELGKNYWPADLEKALTTNGFARELRDLILRASERNLTPDRLALLGKEHGEKYWESAAIFWRQYQDVMDLQTDSAGDAKLRIDPSQIVAEAFYHLRANPDIASTLRARFTSILVDEFQESDPAQRQLLREIVGNDVLLCADADSAIGRFRGADPDQLGPELDWYLEKGKQIVLHDVFRNAPEIFAVGQSVSGEFRGSAPQRKRMCAGENPGVETTLEPAGSGLPEPADTLELQPVVIGRFRSASEEAQFIAYQFRHARLINGTPWSEMAVILRTPGIGASVLRRALSQAGIPVASEIAALSGNPAITPFLLLAQIAIGEKKLTLDNCEKLLLAEFGGADAVSLRRIRRTLIASRESDDQRSGSELLIAAIDTGELFIEGADSLVRIHELLAKARKVLRSRNTQAEDLLWEIWNNALTSDGQKLSESWRRQALRGGNRGASADRDLDAMMQLFESARRFAERFPHSKAESFIRQISHEDILGDVITAQGQRPDVVEILTVHSSKGREWEIVAIAGLQEGVWPNLKQRGSLLGSERLVERIRHGAMARKELDALTASGLVEDERRLLHVAVTRAKTQLIVSAVQREDDEPSTYFEEIATHVLGEWSTDPVMTALPRPITPAALVATLRSELYAQNREMAAQILARLGKEGLKEADVDAWAGVTPVSSTAPVIAPDDLVRVSPSGAESFTECGMKWFLERSGGQNGDSTAQVLGSAIHAFAELMENDRTLTEADLVAKLQAAWKLIEPSTGWVSTSSLDRAIEMIHRFVKYHTSRTNEIVGVEAKFKITVGRALISGSADRLEITAEGDLYVIDFKTGKTMIQIEDAKANRQMAAYQLAILEGGFALNHESRTSAGAELVYLANGVDATLRKQPVIDVEKVKADIEEIAEGMGAATFLATVGERCRTCDLRNVCPIQSDGRAVME